VGKEIEKFPEKKVFILVPNIQNFLKDKLFNMLSKLFHGSLIISALIIEI
jgi:hypothetical protein